LWYPQMNNNPLFLFIQRSTRFDTGTKNITSTIHTCANFAPHQKKALAQQTGTGPTPATWPGGGQQRRQETLFATLLVRCRRQSRLAQLRRHRRLVPSRRKICRQDPPASPTLPRRALTVRSRHRGCCCCWYFPIR
jgi:hypothetical protein